EQCIKNHHQIHIAASCEEEAKLLKAIKHTPNQFSVFGLLAEETLAKPMDSVMENFAMAEGTPQEVVRDMWDLQSGVVHPTGKGKGKVMDGTDNPLGFSTEKPEGLVSKFEVGGNSFEGMKKKKKTKKAVKIDCLEDNIDLIADSGHGQKPGLPRGHSSSSEEDYGYEEACFNLLAKVYNALRENHPELGLQVPLVMSLPLPQILRGRTKSVLVNFKNICEKSFFDIRMRREPNHVMSFILDELTAEGFLDELQRLILRGQFKRKHFENALNKYTVKYVKCNGCQGPNTEMRKENGLFFLKCQLCGAERSVNRITAGFFART
ncbi:hypothetical protein Tsubulata_000111, partial [Turnera subulata]